MRDKGVASLLVSGPNINISVKTPISPVIIKANNNSTKNNSNIENMLYINIKFLFRYFVVAIPKATDT